MSLPNSYTLKPAAVPDYFDAILNAEAPERFSQRFLENLGFKSTNDRTFIAILKDLRFLDTDGTPTDRYYRFHDRTQWKRVLAEGIRDSYSDLFAVNKSAYDLSTEQVTNKLRTLYVGSKSNKSVERIARTFTALVALADFSENGDAHNDVSADFPVEQAAVEIDRAPGASPTLTFPQPRVGVSALQYHINIVLPPSKDRAVFDAIFKSLRDHLG